MPKYTKDEYFMAKALKRSRLSKDPDSQVGACIINEIKTVVGLAHNSMPNGHKRIPWIKPENSIDNKNLYVCHAELNAIINKTCMKLENCVMYVTHHPCNECAKIIKQSKIKEVVYMNDKWPDRLITIASKRILRNMTRQLQYTDKIRKLSLKNI